MRAEWLRTRGARRTVVAVGAAVLVAAGVGATYSPLFTAREVRVLGARRVAAERIYALGNIAPGTNVFHLDAGRAAAAIADHPWIAEANVERRLPDAIVVRVREHVPVAWVRVDGRRRLVGEDGTLLPGPPVAGLPELRPIGGSLDPSERTAIGRVLAALAGPTRREVAAVFVEADGELVLAMRDRVTVRYGPPTRSEAKAQALEAILRWTRRHGVALQLIDVAVPEAPTVRRAP